MCEIRIYRNNASIYGDFLIQMTQMSIQQLHNPTASQSLNKEVICILLEAGSMGIRLLNRIRSCLNCKPLSLETLHCQLITKCMDNKAVSNYFAILK